MNKTKKLTIGLLTLLITFSFLPLFANDDQTDSYDKELSYEKSYKKVGDNYLLCEKEDSDFLVYLYEGDKTVYYQSLILLEKGWLETEDALYYVIDNRKLASLKVEIDDKTILFDEYGVFIKELINEFPPLNNTDYEGLSEIGGFLYFYKNGNPISGFVQVGKDFYYFSKNDYRAVKGWNSIEGKKYYFNESYHRVNGYVTIGELTYYFNSKGVLLTGWQTINKVKYYFKSDGSMPDSLMKIGSYYYGFNASGKMLKGLKVIEGDTYYFSTNGRRYKGWKTVSKSRYYFKSNGKAAVGLTKIGKYYYNFTKAGKMTKKWQNIDGKKYYFNSYGRLLTGWRKIGSYKYYITVSGGVKTGKQKIGSYTYYFNSEGRLKTGWVHEADDKHMYFNKKGRMLKGWQTISKKKYYFDSSGYAKVGKHYIGNYLYYFDNKGVMAKSSWKSIAEETYYFDSKGHAVKGVQKIKGVNYVFDKTTYVLMNNFRADDKGNIYYLDADGKRLKGFQWVEGIKYFFNSDGVMLRKNAKKFIDVSEFNTINWATLASMGDLDGIIIRLGFTGSQSGKPTLDAKALSNIRNAEKYNIPYGIYWYGYCSTTACAKAEGDFVVKTLKDNNFKLKHQVFYDAEAAKMGDYYKTVIPVFGDIVSKGGYKVGVYGSLSWLNDKKRLNHPDIMKYDIWVAQWYTICQFSGKRTGWQYTSNGSIPGISGRVDMDLWE